jgi:hypothetical protein
MWNQVNYTQNYYANIGMSAPYNQWSYPMVSCPHQRRGLFVSALVCRLKKKGESGLGKFLGF